MQGIIHLEQTIFQGHNVAAVLWLQFMLHKMSVPMLNLLYVYITTFRTIFAVPNMPFFVVP
jgi:hypothetical protein